MSAQAELHPDSAATLAAVGAGKRWLCDCLCRKQYSTPAGSASHACPRCGELSYLRALSARVSSQMNMPHLQLTLSGDQVIACALALGEIDEELAARLQDPLLGEPFELRWI
ncbi:hypothetical protein RB608_24880 [Nocardioides sp. LHD-245]|uniref:hypothetical protein n=1 Tax=Nocardioides sp. LHD-245 TaxID=3051387 RepID=UPI0027E0A53B|nr:hypothetical protein [Nocardioides sp. LHD-245]